MTIDDTLINKLSKLSSLEIAEEKRENLKAELAEIVEFVENLNDIDVSHVDATFTTVEGGAALREDVAVQNQELSKHIIEHSPKSENGYFIVPKIIE
ncbi:MAG: Asp-tRNA(Asn)/Glu-tRNA(Gln) amidotransferase subunit GatC [Arcobacteraceae bacterium]|nr:Asp-tRNA(Asn)/Glu-tRNA(Gln) amidotransferase subunit GatC [Arcobacteraceae bacterium]